MEGARYVQRLSTPSATSSVQAPSRTCGPTDPFTEHRGCTKRASTSPTATLSAAWCGIDIPVSAGRAESGGHLDWQRRRDKAVGVVEKEVEVKGQVGQVIGMLGNSRGSVSPNIISINTIDADVLGRQSSGSLVYHYMYIYYYHL